MAAKRGRVRTQSLSFSVDTAQAQAVMDALGDAARGRLMAQVSAALADSGQVLAGKVRVATRRIPSWGLYGSNVRATIASNVESRSGVGDGGAWVRIEVNQNGLPRGLAAAMDTETKRPVPGHGLVFGFRHPVWGRKVWVNQAGYPYFARTLRNQKKVTDRALREAMARFAEDITRNG